MKTNENKVIYQDDKILKFLIESPKYGNKEVIIDIEDWENIKQYRWFLSYQSKRNKFYVMAFLYLNQKRIHIKLHRLILNVTNPKIQVDHRLGDTFDNRKEMLRKCTSVENTRNQIIRKNNTSGYKGVCWRRDIKKWQTRICVNNKNKSVGFFKNKEKAALAYNKAALKYYGEFAKLNQIGIEICQLN